MFVEAVLNELEGLALGLISGFFQDVSARDTPNRSPDMVSTEHEPSVEGLAAKRLSVELLPTRIVMRFLVVRLAARTFHDFFNAPLRTGVNDFTIANIGFAPLRIAFRKNFFANLGSMF